MTTEPHEIEQENERPDCTPTSVIPLIFRGFRQWNTAEEEQKVGEPIEHETAPDQGK